MESLKVRSPRRLTLEVRLLAPQLGGGASPKVVDRDQWLRPAAVRGALRFWWRAIYAPTCQSISEMRAREGAIFGAAASGSGGPSPLAVMVIAQNLEQEQLYQFNASQAETVAYFPGQGMGQEPKSKLLLRGSATLIVADSQNVQLSLSDTQWLEVKQALIAFILFGGSGSRTRKTAGSLGAYSGDIDALGLPTSEKTLQEWFNALPEGKAPGDVFSLGQAKLYYVYGTQSKILEMWKSFRQDRKQRFSRTGWPEPDAIRIIKNTYAKWSNGVNHKPKINNEGRAPRAHLGLPIVFKFRYDRINNSIHPERGHLLETEPSKTEIGIRYASPIILSLTRFGNQNVGLVLITPSALRSDNEIIIKNSKKRLKPGEWRNVELKLLSHLDKLGFCQIERLS
ncbi:type III-B CRISPR module RAMP protein Cmr1 [Myxococcota bacterium]|nr:type III-B CRISPR module RAMP protein Cmr1 [Myxococcota bacterium]